MTTPIEIDDATRPRTDEQLAGELALQVVDASDAVRANAVDYAEQRLNERTARHGVRGFVNRIWFGNIARDYFRQRDIQRGRDEITASGNVYALADGTQAEHDQASAAVVERFTGDFLHEGEKNNLLANIEHGQELETGLRALIHSFAIGDIDHDALQEERTRLLADFGRRVHQRDRNRGLLFADNVIEVAENARRAFNVDGGFGRIDRLLGAYGGEARMGVRTEQRTELTDKILDKVYSTGIGSAINETTLAAAASVAITASKLTARKTSTVAAAFLGMGVGVGIIAGAREHLRMGQDRRTHLRQLAEGETMTTASGRKRERLEATRYQTVSAGDLLERLNTAHDNLSDDPATLAALLNEITEARTRVELSDGRSIDLISYTSKASVEQERLALDQGLRRAEESLTSALADDDTFAASGLASRDVGELVQERSLDVVAALDTDIQARDRVFRAERRRQTAKMAAIGALGGLVIGDIIQEAHAAVSNELQGVFEGHSSGQTRQTLLASAFGDHSGHQVTGAEVPADLQQVDIGEHATMRLPAGDTLVKSSSGGWQLVGADHKTLANGLQFDQQGHLTAASQQLLTSKGFDFSEQIHDYTTTVHKLVPTSSNNYINQHPDQFTTVHRELWYDNDTPNVFDKNELRLDWGGQSASGIDANGNYVFNVSDMTPGGSYHDGLSANAQQLIHEGKMRIALSMTRGTQTQVFMVPVDSHGDAIIDAHSYIGQSLFEDQAGHAHYIGAYAEAVQTISQNADGSDTVRMLATVVGNNDPHAINEIINQTIQHEQIITSITHPGVLPVQIPPVLPIYGRRGLEALNRPEEAVPYYYQFWSERRPGEDYLVGTGSWRRDRRSLAPFAPELASDPDAEIDANAVAKRYDRSLRPSYKRTITSLAAALDKQPKAAHPRAIIMIPAAAHQEGRNIYRTLIQYARQQGIDEDDFEVVVFANNPRGTRRDKTIKEIQRFQREHREIKVRLIERRLEKPEANIGWIRKAVADSVIEDLRRRGINLNDVVLTSNDADSEWIDPRYIKTILNKAAAEPNTDGFLGFIDWSYDAYKAYPQMLAATRLMQMIEMYLRRSEGQLSSSGANFTFRPGMYMAVGGYQSKTSLGEDVVLGRMIKSVRAGANSRRPIAFLGRSSEVNTSARRALEKLLKDGGAPARQWDDDFGPNDELRTKNYDLTDFDFNDEAAVTKLVASTEKMLNQTLRVYASGLTGGNTKSYRQGRLTMFNGETLRQLNRMFFFIGVKVAWQPDGSIAITDAQAMLAGLRRWQARH